MKGGFPPAGVCLIFRPATVDNLAFCYLTYVDGMRAPVERVYGWDEDDRRAIFASVFRLGEAWIIESRIGPAAADVGWIQVEEQADCFHVKELHIVRASRNHGLGAWALGRVIDDASAAGKDVRLSTFRASPAVRFYRRLGFRTVRRQGDVLNLARPCRKASARAEVLVPARRR